MHFALRASIVLLSAIALSGCATKYQDMGFAGGVQAQQMTADTYRIVSRGNGYTDSSTVRDYAVLKAAETARANGATHFLLVGADDASRVDTVVTPGTANTTFAGNTAFTTYSPAQAVPVFKPGQDLYVRLLTLRPGQTPPPGAIAADEIIRFVGGRVERG